MGAAQVSRPGADPGRDTSSSREIVRFAVLALVAIVLLGLLAGWVVGRVATQESLDDAVTTATVLGRTVVEPRLTNDLLAGRGAALREMDAALAPAVDPSDVVTVRIWNSDGVVVYSDEPRLIGERFDLGGDVRAALAAGEPEVEVSDLSLPENRYEQGEGELVEVYLPLRAAGGEPLLLEVYRRQETIQDDTRNVWWNIAPLLVGVLLVLAAIIVGLAVWMASRISRENRTREALLRRALDASDTERRSLAADLHDGVVQDLVGVSYVLSGLASASEDPGFGAELSRAGAQTRSAVTALRSLLVDIYPANLSRTGLAAALRTLGERMDAEVTVIVAAVDTEDLPDDVQATLYRIAREAMQNVAKHARARYVSVSLARHPGAVELTIADDGVGFDRTLVGDEALGLRISEDAAEVVGGELGVSSQPGRGTTVTVRVPL